MLITGDWLVCPDDIVRPVILGEALTAQGIWLRVPFLVDTGADRTLFSAPIRDALALPSITSQKKLAGVGGVAPSVLRETQIRLTYAPDAKAVMRGHFAALLDPAALDMSVLGRDVTRFFAVIADFPGNLVCLVSQRHRYRIEEVG